MANKKVKKQDRKVWTEAELFTLMSKDVKDSTVKNSLARATNDSVHMRRATTLHLIGLKAGYDLDLNQTSDLHRRVFERMYVNGEIHNSFFVTALEKIRKKKEADDKKSKVDIDKFLKDVREATKRSIV